MMLLDTCLIRKWLNFHFNYSRSFNSQVIAVFVTRRYRNQRNPIYDLPVRAIFPSENYEYC